MQLVVDAFADGGNVFITVTDKSVDTAVTPAPGENLPGFLMEPFISAKIEEELAKGASVKLSLPVLNLAPGSCSLPANSSLSLTGNVRNAGLVPAAELTYIALGLELGLDQESVAETWAAFFSGPSECLLTGAQDFAIQIDGPRLARYIASQARSAMQKDDSIVSIDSIDGYWAQPFSLFGQGNSGLYMVHVDAEVDVKSGDQTVDNVDVDLWVHFEVPAPGNLRITMSIDTDVGFWEAVWETLKASITGLKFGMGLDPTPFGIGSAIGFIVGPFVAGFKFLFENPEVDPILPDCTTEDDGHKQICTFSLPMSSTEVGALTVTGGTTDSEGLILGGSATVKTKKLPLPSPIQMFDHQLEWGLGCPSKLDANTPPFIVLSPTKVTVGSPGTSLMYPSWPCEYRLSPDPLGIYGFYLHGGAFGWTFNVGVKKSPEEISELGTGAYPLAVMARTSAGVVIHRFQPPVWNAEISKKLETEWPVAKQTCQFKHIVAEANWHQKQIEFHPDPTHLDPTGMLDQFIIFSMSNLVPGESVSAVDSASSPIVTAVPGPAGRAWGYLPARHLSDGFVLDLRTTAAGDRIRRSSGRTTPGPFSMWLYSWHQIASFSVLGRPLLLLPTSPASGLLHVLAGGTLSSIRLGSQPMLADQIGVEGATHVTNLAEEALVLGGTFGLAQLLPGGRPQVERLTTETDETVLGLARQRDRLFVLTEDGVTAYRIRTPLRTSAERVGRFAVERTGEVVIDSSRGCMLSGHHLAVATPRGITAVAVAEDSLTVAGSLEFAGIDRIGPAERRMGRGMVYVELADGAAALVDLAGVRGIGRQPSPVTRLGTRPVWVDRPSLGEVRFDASGNGRVVVELLRDRVNLVEQLRG